jgi:prepilin-type N-terminal cleavage/methylation domain-containing protein
LHKLRSGFTIIEIIVVIVVIGIISTLVVVSYSGVTQRAAVVAVQSDLDHATDQLDLDHFHNGSYPASESAADGGSGLPKSEGTVYNYVLYGNDYCLSATSNAAVDSYYKMSTNDRITLGTCPQTWKSITSGWGHTCAIAYNDKVYCWGNNSVGQLGDNSTTNSLTPVAVDTTNIPGDNTFKMISATGNVTCGVAVDDKAYCWGETPLDEFYYTDIIHSQLPVAVDTTNLPGDKTVKSVIAGYMMACLVAVDDKAYCWGNNSYGMLGNNSTTESYIPVSVDTTNLPGDKTVKSISLGETHACVIAVNDNAYCWGSNYSGELGNGNNTDSHLPIAVSTGSLPGDKTIKLVFLGRAFTCAIANDDKVYCWGWGQVGQLGHNATSSSNIAVAVNTTNLPGDDTVKTIATSSEGDAACVIAVNDRVYCWGL